MQSDPTTSTTREPLLITAAELADMMRISLRSLWRMRNSGHLPQPIRLGGVVRWRTNEVEAWINQGCPSVDKQAYDLEEQV